MDNGEAEKPALQAAPTLSAPRSTELDHGLDAARVESSQQNCGGECFSCISLIESYQCFQQLAEDRGGRTTRRPVLQLCLVLAVLQLWIRALSMRCMQPLPDKSSSRPSPSKTRTRSATPSVHSPRPLVHQTRKGMRKEISTCKRLSLSLCILHVTVNGGNIARHGFVCPAHFSHLRSAIVPGSEALHNKSTA